MSEDIRAPPDFSTCSFDGLPTLPSSPMANVSEGATLAVDSFTKAPGMLETVEGTWSWETVLATTNCLGPPARTFWVYSVASTPSSWASCVAAACHVDSSDFDLSMPTW